MNFSEPGAPFSDESRGARGDGERGHDDRRRLDTVVLVPFQPHSGHGIEPLFRQTMGSHFTPHFLSGYSEFARFVGRDLMFRGANRPAFGEHRAPIEFTTHRSLTAVSLATHLERAGLRWRVIDPGQQEIRYWRKQLERFRRHPPHSVGISTTFSVGGRWLRALCAVVRDVLPSATLIIGGYYYTSDAADFLSLDADVFCVGEGEQRLEQIVARIRDGAALDDIPGLYLRRAAGPLHYTGRAEPLRLDDLPPPDWSLVERIDPPKSLKKDFIDFAVETQRGCVFKCEFCTYRTLAQPNFMSTDIAVERILSTRAASRALVRLTDSTATFPHERWRELMQKLIDKGGSPHPLWVYARVSDIDERTAELMSRAGVREVFIGQESGDQRVLNLMKKGTHVSQVKPALAALHKHGIWAFVSFIHGFPGEDAQSIQATRSLICALNDGFPEGRPAVPWYNANPFLTQDFASVAEKTGAMEKGMHYLGFDPGGGNSSQRMTEECLATMIAVSRIPNAPVYIHLLTFLDSPSHGAVEPEPSIMGNPDREEFLGWMKAVERGMAIFIERDLDGKAPDLAELRRLKEKVLAKFPRPHGALHKVAAGVAHRVVPLAGGYMRSEWARESRRGIGLATRVGLSLMALRDSGKIGPALACLRSGEYHPIPVEGEQPVETRDAAFGMAREAVEEARRSSKRLTQIIRAANGQSPTRTPSANPAPHAPDEHGDHAELDPLMELALENSLENSIAPASAPSVEARKS